MRIARCPPHHESETAEDRDADLRIVATNVKRFLDADRL